MLTPIFYIFIMKLLKKIYRVFTNNNHYYIIKAPKK